MIESPITIDENQVYKELIDFFSDNKNFLPEENALEIMKIIERNEI